MPIDPDEGIVAPTHIKKEDKPSKGKGKHKKEQEAFPETYPGFSGIVHANTQEGYGKHQEPRYDMDDPSSVYKSKPESGKASDKGKGPAGPLEPASGPQITPSGQPSGKGNVRAPVSGVPVYKLWKGCAPPPTINLSDHNPYTGTTRRDGKKDAQNLTIHKTINPEAMGITQQEIPFLKLSSTFWSYAEIPEEPLRELTDQEAIYYGIANLYPGIKPEQCDQIKIIFCTAGNFTLAEGSHIKGRHMIK